MAAFAKAPFGTGDRMKACLAKMKGKKGIRNPGAVCASIGREAHGKAKFQAAAARARKRGRGR